MSLTASLIKLVLAEGTWEEMGCWASHKIEADDMLYQGMLLECDSVGHRVSKILFTPKTIPLTLSYPH